MTARQSAAVDRALALIDQPKPEGGTHTAYSAAKAEGLALSTIYRALKRMRLTLREKRPRSAGSGST